MKGGKSFGNILNGEPHLCSVFDGFFVHLLVARVSKFVAAIKTHDDCLPRTVSLLLLSIFAVNFWVSGHLSTGRAVSGSTGRVMNAPGASARAL